MAGHARHRPAHGHVHLGEAEWRAAVEHTELEGQVLLSFVSDTAAWLDELRGRDAPPVLRIVDIGSGPGVGTCELARRFPEAHVIAVDGSPAMLERAKQRIKAQGLERRVTTHCAELPAGLEGLEPADLIWASMSLHHIGDEVGSLRVLHDLLRPDGRIAIAEMADPMRVLPEDLDVGRPGLVDRLDRAAADWFAAMREDLGGADAGADLPSKIVAAGFEVIASRLARLRIDPPLPDEARRMAVEYLRRRRTQLEDLLEPGDLEALDVLTTVDDPRGLANRPDALVAASRQIVIARPMSAAAAEEQRQ